ncbi:MAG: bacterial regulatory helix-turn-helix, lysR family protein [Burkholderia sp.]|jgi:LysR family nitrogen assimilation transcriptional regulator|nr:bacterial regulatory helix-turn-helix, lysR family protein [Burkholderia sp.]
MDIKRIEYLIQVAEFGSFSKAATVVGIAQPALGRQVQKLEEDCGVRLLYRHGRGVSLTPEGEMFIDRVRPLLRQLEAVATDLQDERESPSGVVTIGITPTICNMLGLHLVTTVQEKYPKLRVNVVSGYSGYIHEWLIDGRLDLAILHDARRSQHLAVEHLADAKLSLVSSPKLLNAVETKRRSLALRRLEGLPLALPTKNHGLRRTLELAASQAGFALDVKYEVDTLALMKEIVLAGFAHTVLALPAVQSEIESGKLIARRISQPDVETRLVLAKASNRPLTRAVRIIEQETRNVFHRIRLDASFDLGLKIAI